MRRDLRIINRPSQPSLENHPSIIQIRKTRFQGLMIRSSVWTTSRLKDSLKKVVVSEILRFQSGIWGSNRPVPNLLWPISLAQACLTETKTLLMLLRIKTLNSPIRLCPLCPKALTTIAPLTNATALCLRSTSLESRNHSRMTIWRRSATACLI